MNVVINRIKESTLEEFAELHGLTLEINECPARFGSLARFYACFRDTYAAEGSVVMGVFGNGSTPEEAVDEYAKRISDKSLVVVKEKNRTEIKAPLLVSNPRVNLESMLRSRYTYITKVTVEDNPGAYLVLLRVGNQSFTVGEYRSTQAEALWMQDMLVKALANIVTNNR